MPKRTLPCGCTQALLHGHNGIASHTGWYNILLCSAHKEGGRHSPPPIAQNPRAGFRGESGSSDLA